MNREYTVLAASGCSQDQDRPMDVVAYQEFAPFHTTFSVAPSFEHVSDTINRNPQLYEVVYSPGEAYCIYAKRNGAIVQMHYNELDALKEVISALIKRYPSAWAKNVDCRYSDVIQMLSELGFGEVTKQYEMARDLSLPCK